MSDQEQGSPVGRSARRGAERKPAKPLDEARLRDLALAYVARFATTGTRLERYLARKLRERGWEGERAPDLPALSARFAELGYVDDAVWAGAKSGDLLRRGYGARRIGQALSEAGVDEATRAAAAPGQCEQRQAAVDLARRKRFGPFSREPAQPTDPARRQKQLAAMARAGHGFELARRVIDAESEADLESWVDEARYEPGHEEQE